MFEPQTLVSDALSLHPNARWVFAAYHIGGCRSCERAADETLEQVASGYGIPLERLLGDLNGLIEVTGLRGYGVEPTPKPRNHDTP